MQRHKTVDEFIAHFSGWDKELRLLRSILLKTPMKECVKWGMPVYTYQNKNIIGIGAFKKHIGLWFHQGVFLEDKQKKLVNAQENKTKAMRQWRFEHINEIDEDLILAYAHEAIQNQIDGKEIKPNRTRRPVIIPDLLQNQLNIDQVLQEKFEKFTLGNQRDFAEYIETAKRNTTKLKRIEKIIPMIKDGVRLNDKYKK